MCYNVVRIPLLKGQEANLRMQTATTRYHDAIDAHGLRETWASICRRTLMRCRPDLTLGGEPSSSVQPIDASFADGWACDALPDWYEEGLAYADKESKKSLGQYYTPRDTARFMASRLVAPIADGKVLVEPCVGCGNLLVEMLRLLPNPWEVATERLLTFDLDATAVLVAKTRIIAEFAPTGLTVSFDDIDCRIGDFLTSGFDATDEHVVISNPPYGRTADSAYSGHRTFGIRDLYPLFLEHLMGAHMASVIVPQGFLGSKKFSSLRSVMSEKAGGSIIAYDNIPGSIFNRRKHGVFNTNTANSVRAAIILSECAKADSGWHVSPMIRWLSEERSMLFDASERLLAGTIAVSGPDIWPKVPPSLSSVYMGLKSCSRMASITDDDGEYELRVPITPRYFMTAALMPLSRSSFHVLRFADKDSMRLAYLVLNSSVSYCWWRWADGGITITQGTLAGIPLPTSLTDEMRALADRLIATEPSRVVTKMNAGRPNQNLKLPAEEIDKITRTILPGRAEREYEALAVSHSNSLAKMLPTWADRAGTQDNVTT